MPRRAAAAVGVRRTPLGPEGGSPPAPERRSDGRPWPRAATWPLAVVAGGIPAAALVASTLLGLPGRFNDFSSYWLAGRLVAAGQSPYDLAALTTLGRREGLDFLVGSGYSYPPPFAVAMVPLSALPFTFAAWLFSLVSAAAFGLAAAAWLARAGLSTRRSLVLAALAGAYPPIVGSAYFGQANLLIVAVLVLAMDRLLPRDGGRGGRGSELIAGLGIGLVGVVKLVPLVLLVPLLLGRRWVASAGLIAAALGALLVAAVVAPASGRGGSQLAELLGADGFWSNQSLNGLATRLVVPTDRTAPLLPGLDPTVLGVAFLVLVALPTAVALWSARRSALAGGLGLGLSVALLAGIAGAPKDSFWNHAPALLAVAQLVPGRGAGTVVPARGLRLALGAWYGGAWLEALVDRTEGGITRPLGPAGALVSSLAILGLLALWAWLTARLALGARAAEGRDAEVSAR
ncbi:MAG TPA: glycosyltransferase family 87 protein [Candidatus Limnocylindrales bacterium]